MTLQWLAVDLRGGTIICELPGISASQPFKRTIGRYETQQVTLAVDPDETAPEWLDATRPGASALIAVRGDPGAETIHWGGVVLRRTRTSSNQVPLDLATVECYLDRRYTGAYSVTGRSQNLIVSDLIASFAAANQGLPITVQDVTISGSTVPTLDRTFYDYDDKTVYSRLGDLAGLVTGPEWTGHWTWNRTTNVITPVIYVANRLGTPATAGFAPGVTFDRSNLIDFTLTEDYTAGSGANDVLGIGVGQGLSRLQSSAIAANFNGRPRFQFRYTPSTSTPNSTELTSHATDALALLQNGIVSVTLQASALSGPQLGTDWNLGDDIGYELEGKALPQMVSGTARCIGYETDDHVVSPILYVPAVS